MGQIPEVTEEQKQRHHISSRDFLIYLGPSLIISLAFLDPGCLATDIAAGASFNYDLLWALFLASFFAIFLQYLSGKLGIATGLSLPELIRGSLRSKPQRIAYWLSAEFAVAVTDLSEYLGTVIALNILFGIPLLDASFLAAADVLILLAIANGRFRLMEYCLMFFVSVICIGFLYEFAIVGANLQQMAIHSVMPIITPGDVLIVVGILGATVMPHTLWLHSSLTRDKVNRWGIRQNEELPKKKLLRIHLREVTIILAIAAFINATILVMAASAFYPKYSNDIAQLNDVYNILRPLFGPISATVFGLALLASGISASTVGTLAGQEVMTGLLGIKVNKYLRRLVTRGINVFPTTYLLLLGISPLALLIYTQVILSLCIPLPMIPLIWYTSRGKLMGSFVNRKVFSIIAVSIAVVIIALNVVLIYSSL